MSTIFLDRSELEVRHESGALVFYENGRRSGTVPIGMLERVVIQGARTRLDSSVLMHLANAGVATVFISPRASRRVACLLGRGHNDASIRIAQSLCAVDAIYCAGLARKLMLAKIRRQLQLLSQALERRPAKRRVLAPACRTLAVLLSELERTHDHTCTSLRGVEGSAARIYFGALAGLVAPSLQFSGRNKRPPRDPVNACLSLSYTLLHYDAVRASHAAGLDPLIGFYHRPSFARESLACDLIEPLRPCADEWVLELFASRWLRQEHFSNDKGACLLGKSGRGRFYAEWEKWAASHRRWLRKQSLLLARDMQGRGDQLIGQLT